MTLFKHFLYLFEVRDLIQVVTTPTHKAGNTIDWIVTRSFIPIFDLDVFNNCISDHFLISFKFDSGKPKRKTRFILSRNLKSISSESFGQDIKNACIRLLSNENCKASAYFDELSSVLDCHAPMRERRVTDRPSAPWMTALDDSRH